MLSRSVYVSTRIRTYTCSFVISLSRDYPLLLAQRTWVSIHWSAALLLILYVLVDNSALSVVWEASRVCYTSWPSCVHWRATYMVASCPGHTHVFDVTGPPPFLRVTLSGLETRLNLLVTSSKWDPCEISRHIDDLYQLLSHMLEISMEITLGKSR